MIELHGDYRDRLQLKLKAVRHRIRGHKKGVRMWICSLRDRIYCRTFRVVGITKLKEAI